MIENYQPSIHDGFYGCSVYDGQNLISVSVYLSSKSYSNDKKIYFHYFKVFNIKSYEKSSIHSKCLSKNGKTIFLDIIDRKIKPANMPNLLNLLDPEIFLCQVHNGSKTDNFSIFIRGYTENISKIDLKIKLKYIDNCSDYGCSIILICEIKPNSLIKNYELIWLKEDKNIPKNAYLNESSLIIENIREKELGIYTCTATRDNKIHSKSSVVFFDKDGSIKHAIQNISELSDEQELDERLRYLFRSKELELGSSFAIECLDLYYDSFLPSWRLKGNHQTLKYTLAPHILIFTNFTFENLGSYVCRTKNKKGLLVELGLKIEFNDFGQRLKIINIKEKILNDEIQKAELAISKNSRIPNIKISFSDKVALANGERVQIFCDSDKKAKIEWFKVNPSGEQGKLISSQNSIIKSPIYNEDLGRYRCIATNKFGYRSRDAVLTRQNDSVEYFVYGYVDRFSEFSFENNGQELSLYRYKQIVSPLSLKIKEIYDKDKNLKLKCFSNFKKASLKWVIPRSNDIISSSSLYLGTISDQNVGTYECIGNYKNQNAKMIYSIENYNGSIVARPQAFVYSYKKNFIRLDFLSNIKNINLNDRLEIACSSKQGTKTRWFRKLKEISQSSLIIKSFSFENLKFYECRTIDKSNLSVGIRFKQISKKKFEGLVENFDRRINNRLKKSSEQRELQMPDLKINLISPQKQFFKIGERIILKCSTDTIKNDVSVDWHKEADKIDQDIRIIELNRTQKILIIDSFMLEHIGIYTCSVKIKNSIFYEHENWLKIFILNSVLKDLYETRVVYSKLTPNLNCKLTFVSKIQFIECNKKDESLTSKWLKFSNMSVKFLNQTGIQLAPNEEANYEYSSENNHGISKILFNVKSNQVYWSEFISLTKIMSQLVFENSKVSRKFAKIDSQVILNCPLKSDQILWFKSGKLIANSHQTNSSNLLFNRVKFSDSGSYECSTIEFKEFHTIELILSEPIPMLIENSYLQFNISSYLKNDKFLLAVSFKPYNLDGIIWNMSETDQFITVRLNNGVILYESKQINSFDVLVKIPKIVKLKKWNQLTIELANQEVKFVLNDQSFKIFSDYNVQSIPKILSIGTDNLQKSNFIGIVSSLVVNQKKIDLINSALKMKNVNLKNICNSSNCKENEECIVAQNEVGYKCY